MKIFPVIDVLGGVVVRGVAGRRSEYRPCVSRLVSGCDPLDYARAFRAEFRCDELYLADLDAILHQRPNLMLYDLLLELGFRVRVDAGIRRPDDADRIIGTRRLRPILGLETLAWPHDLRAIVSGQRITHLAPDDWTFSLDLRQGRPVASEAWPATPVEIATCAVEAGIGEILVLDLWDVGSETGGSTSELCLEIQRRHPEIRLITGGGIRGRNDLKRLADAGMYGVLIASALHDGLVTKEDMSHLRDSIDERPAGAVTRAEELFPPHRADSADQRGG